MFLKLQLSTCGVSKTNTKLTHVLKITTQQLRSLKIKRHEYPLNFHIPPIFLFFFSKTKFFISLCFSCTSTSTSHQHLHLPFLNPNLNNRYLASPIIINSDETDLSLVGKRPLSLFLSHHHRTLVIKTSIFPRSTPNLDSHNLASPTIISSNETDLCLVEKRPKLSLCCFQPRR